MSTRADVHEERMLRLAVRRVLSEDFGGMDFGGYDMGGYGGMGGGWITSERIKQLVGIFAAPFQEALAAAELVIPHAEALMKTVFEASVSSLVIGVSADYDKIFADRDQKIERINGKYADIRKASMDAFRTTDFMVCSFVMYPEAFLTTAFLSKAPQVGYEFLKTAGGRQVQGILDDFAGWWQSGIKHLQSVQSAGKSRRGWDDDEDLTSFLKRAAKGESVSNMTVGRILGEAEEKKQEDPVGSFKEQAAQKLVAILQDKGVQAAIAPTVKKMHAEGTAALVPALEQILSTAKEAVSKVSTVEGLDGLSKGKVKPELEKIQAEVQKSLGEKKDTDSSKKPDVSVPAAVQQGAKDAVKKAALEQLEERSKEDGVAHMPDGHPYRRALSQVQAKVKAL